MFGRAGFGTAAVAEAVEEHDVAEPNLEAAPLTAGIQTARRSSVNCSLSLGHLFGGEEGNPVAMTWKAKLAGGLCFCKVSWRRAW